MSTSLVRIATYLSCALFASSAGGQDSPLPTPGHCTGRDASVLPASQRSLQGSGPADMLGYALLSHLNAGRFSDAAELFAQSTGHNNTPDSVIHRLMSLNAVLGPPSAFQRTSRAEGPAALDVYADPSCSCLDDALYSTNDRATFSVDFALAGPGFLLLHTVTKADSSRVLLAQFWLADSSQARQMATALAKAAGNDAKKCPDRS